jgi:hypothetical protein
MKKLFFLFLINFSVFSQNLKLSPQAEISLLTISPGKELYSTFGHSAIRIKDNQSGLDKNYNYGTFDFNAPNFYLKFLRGKLPYLISAHDFYLEMEYWAYRENRRVVEQKLNLSQNQKQRIFDFLEHNLLPENKEYAYKFFTDNCSTRLRDVFQNACGDSLIFDVGLHADSTYRQWIDKYAKDNNKLWADFGMDLAIGIPSDQVTGWSNAMYIPNNLADALSHAKIKNQMGISDFVISETGLNEIIKTEVISEFSPVLAFSMLFIIVLLVTIFQYKKTNSSLLFDKMFFTILGLAGWILFFLWFFTDHGVTTLNLNLVWAFPLLFPLFLLKNVMPKVFKIFLLLYGIMNLVLLVFIKFLPQEINPAIIPVLLIILLRITFILKTTK